MTVWKPGLWGWGRGGDIRVTSRQAAWYRVCPRTFEAKLFVLGALGCLQMLDLGLTMDECDALFIDLDVNCRRVVLKFARTPTHDYTLRTTS